MGPIKTDAGTYCIDTGRTFVSELSNISHISNKDNITNAPQASVNGNITFISNKLLSSIVTSLNNNTNDTSYLKLTSEQLKLVKDIKK